jgi:hypothetical protein
VKLKHLTERMEIINENLAVEEEKNGPLSEQEEVKKIPMLGFLVPGSIVPMAASNGMLIVGTPHPILAIYPSETMVPHRVEHFLPITP